MKKQYRPAFLICCIGLSTMTLVIGQEPASRSITSDDFVNKRPAKARQKQPKRVTYKFVRVPARKPTRPAGATKVKAPADKLAVTTTEIGITVWRMRPPRALDTGFLLPVRDENGDKKMWLSERVAPGTVFKLGDKVRFAVESSKPGYLYIFDRETYADGSFGEPTLIFPETEAGNNSVKPGMLVDVPDRGEEWPYFNLSTKKPRYAGELLTIIISPQKLTNLKTDENGKLKGGIDLTDFEFGPEVEIFTRTDTSDRFFSKAESESASRSLTRDEPLPQSIYRVKAATGQPAVAFLNLAVR